MNVGLLHALPLDERMREAQRDVLAGSTSSRQLYALGDSSIARRVAVPTQGSRR
jgi:hypothetical protein